MTTCTELSDRMPDVAHGRSRWTEPEAHHLAACADCRAEWALVTAATRLGASLTPPGDPALVTTRLLERLARERNLTRRRVRLWAAAGLAAAAAGILAIWTGAGTGVRPAGSAGGVAPRVATAPVGPSSPSTTGAPVDTGAGGAGAPALATAPDGPRRLELPLPEIDDLPAEALDSMLQALDEPAARADAYELPGLGESGDRELEQALTGLEG